MTFETFFDKFDQFADAPNAVAKLRELVLSLAVQGKLVPQDPNAEQASNLLSQISEEKRKLVSNGAIRRPNEVWEIREDEVPFEVAPGWIWTRLSNITRRIHYGFTASAKTEIKDVRLLRITDIQNNFVDWTSVPGCEILDENISQYQLEKGDILVARTGGTVGKTYLVHDVPVIAVFASYLIRIQVSSLIFDRYLKFFFESPTYWMQLEEGARGAAQPNVNGQTLGNMVVPLPPLAEQRRIVAKIDELMALCDRLEAQLQARDTQQATLARAALARFADAPTPANLELLFHPAFAVAPADLRKSILTLAVQGKLVPQDPNDESVEILCERIQAEKLNKQLEGAYKKYKTLPEIKEPEKPFKLPSIWKWERLRSLAFMLGDGLHGTPEYSEGTDCYFINGNNLIDGKIIIKSHTKTVSVIEMQKHKRIMTLNTVLVSINGTLGNVAFYDNENVILGKSICYFNLSCLIDKYFIRRVVESPYFVQFAIANATGSTIRNLGLEAMNNFPVPLPPLAEQHRIVAKVDELMALVDQLEAQLATARTRASQLLDAMIAELTAS